MSAEPLCPACQTPLPADAPGGLCPRCLLQRGLGSQPDSRTTAYGAFTPPTVAELAPLFPQLEVLELLGQGGMGAVYKARQPGLDRLVALKILPRRDDADPSFAERFTREARTLAKLSHPGIVAVFDFGQVGDLFYFVMEYVDGVNLRQAQESDKLAPAEALAIVPHVCAALQFAHEAGVVHRDIKPENILLDAKGRVKIADFGLAKLLDRPQARNLTGTHQVMGTLHYMAPEQWEKPLTVDHRADIYSLGVVFYEMLTGELPLGRFPLPSQKVQIDVRLDDVVLRTLEKEPERRYQQAGDVKSDVERISSTARPAFEPSKPSASSGPRPAFVRHVVWPMGIIFGICLAVFVTAASLRNMLRSDPNNETAAITLVLGLWVVALSAPILLLRWAARFRGESIGQFGLTALRLLRLNDANTWAILACGVGVANATLPWMVQLNSRHRVGSMTPFMPGSWLVIVVLLALGMVLIALAGVQQLRGWRILATIAGGVGSLATTLWFISAAQAQLAADAIRQQRYRAGLEVSSPELDIWPFPYFSLVISALVVLLGAIDLRSWLTIGSIEAQASAAPSRPLRRWLASALFIALGAGLAVTGLAYFGGFNILAPARSQLIGKWVWIDGRPGSIEFRADGTFEERSKIKVPNVKVGEEITSDAPMVERDSIEAGRYQWYIHNRSILLMVPGKPSRELDVVVTAGELTLLERNGVSFRMKRAAQ